MKNKPWWFQTSAAIAAFAVLMFFLVLVCIWVGSVLYVASNYVFPYVSDLNLPSYFNMIAVITSIGTTVGLAVIPVVIFYILQEEKNDKYLDGGDE